MSDQRRAVSGLAEARNPAAGSPLGWAKRTQNSQPVTFCVTLSNKPFQPWFKVTSSSSEPGGAGDVIRMHDAIVEPDLDTVVAAYFHADGLLPGRMNPRAGVSHALLASQGLQQVHLPRFALIGAGGQVLPMH